MEFIPVNEPLLTGNEKKYLAECVETGWISSDGSFVKRFEEVFAAAVGRRYGVAVCNATAGLEAAVAAAAIGPGDEVIMPAFTIISCAAAVVRAGAMPVLVDCDPLTWNMDIRQVKARITPRTKAIMAVHIYGLPVDMDPLLELAAGRGITVIEDAAEMHGQTYKGRPCGSLGDISVFSFYANKIVTTGEGGMILTDNDGLAQKCRSLRNLCFQERRFVHEELGWNFRMTNLQAAVGLAQLERLPEMVKRKRAIGSRYTSLLSGTGGLQLPAERTPYAENIYWVYGIVLEDSLELDADGFRQALKQRGVDSRPFFWPMHRQPVFNKRGYFRNERYPVAERLSARGFYLPSGMALTEAQQDRVVAAAKEIVA
jgi:perosamine synthetase